MQKLKLKTGHFHFAEKRTFLFCVDSSCIFPNNSLSHFWNDLNMRG